MHYPTLFHTLCEMSQLITTQSWHVHLQKDPLLIVEEQKTVLSQTELRRFYIFIEICLIILPTFISDLKLSI